jgi:hypothetical protein
MKNHEKSALKEKNGKNIKNRTANNAAHIQNSMLLFALGDGTYSVSETPSNDLRTNDREVYITTVSQQ